MKKVKGSAKKETLRQVLAYISRYKLLIIISMIFAAASSALTLYMPILTGNAIDMIIGKGNVNFSAVSKTLLIIGIMVAVNAVLQWFMNTINNRVVYNVVRDIRSEAFAHLQTLPLSYIDSHQHGELVSRLIADVDQFADGLLMGFTQLFTGVVTIIGTLAFMLTIDIKITVLVVFLTPMSFFAAKFIAGRTYGYFRTQSEIRGEQTALIDEMIGNQKIVQAFSYEENAVGRFTEINDKLTKASVKAVFFSSLTNPTTRFINNLIYASVGLTGALSVIRGGLSVGGLTCFLSYANQYTKPFNEISGVITELQNAISCASRIFELIKEKPQLPDSDNAAELKKAEGSVRLDDVSFSYVPEKKLIEHFDLDIHKGQRVAVVGPTGCGKTTLINLLMRFYDVTDGSISVDGYKITDITRSSLRHNYGMVLQETWIKKGTIKENIIMGKPDADIDEVITAAKATYAHNFIKRLPNGYDTVISDANSGLSQGQKQLLCITRIMLSIPPMLILDEATSSIDTRTEKQIQHSFAEMTKGRTSFIVAHRLSTIRTADIILVMKDGSIIEQGTHKQLLEKNGFYANLYNSQFAV